jgi:crotonobetainyl-CoA:carnitine CoA-transferase CaiB-like acyl-CoA transferase
MGKSKGKTAKEVVAELAQDPAYQARLAERQAQAEAQGVAAAKDEEQIVAEFRAAGVAAASVYDFVGKQATPTAAAQVLVRHLSTPHIRVVREGIVRALSFKHLRSVALNALMDGFRQSTASSERWLFANALAAMASLAELTSQLPGISEFAELFPSNTRK